MFKNRFRIDVRTRCNVVAIDRVARTVAVEPDDGSAYTLPYDELVIATGASPIKPEIPGVNREGVFTIRSIPDTDRLKAYIARVGARRAVICGGGFIGIEMAENLVNLGIHVTILERSDHLLPPFDPEIAFALEQWLRTKVCFLMSSRFGGLRDSAAYLYI